MTLTSTLKKKQLSGPETADIPLVTTFFNEKCNCYAYAVQDYLAGQLSDQVNEDFNYVPRPGQTRGKSYMDIINLNEEGMIRAVHEDGINFAGKTYPKKIPEGFYVICCFLEPGQYHFIRQNRDGSWSSKNGPRNPPSYYDSRIEGEVEKKIITNPEDFYKREKDYKNYKFVGYFFVPNEGVHIGLKAYERKRLQELKEKNKSKSELREQSFLEEFVKLSDLSDEVVKKMRELFDEKDPISQEKCRLIWEDYQRQFSKISMSCKAYTRTKALKKTLTHPKSTKLIEEKSR